MGSESDPVEPWQTDPDADFEYHRFDADQLEPQVARLTVQQTRLLLWNTTTSVRMFFTLVHAPAPNFMIISGCSLHSQRKQGAIRNRILGCPSSKGLPRSQERRGDENPGRRRSQNSSTSCGLCAGYGPQRLGQGTVCLSSTARNFKGRMGDESSEVYLASPMTVASTAVTGYISDPRNFLGAS